MIGWCRQCLGFDLGSQKVAPLHQPLKSAHNNLRLRRSIASRVNASDDSECTENESEDEPDEHHHGEREEHFIRKGSSRLNHPMIVPSTIVVQIQPDSETIHRPDLVNSNLHAGDLLDTSAISTPMSSTSSNLQCSGNGSLDGSIHTIGSTRSLQSIGSSGRKLSITSSQYDALLANLSETSSLPDLHDSLGKKRPFITLEYRRRRPMKFLSPEDAAKPAAQSPVSPSNFSNSKFEEYSTKNKSLWLGKSMPSLFRGDESVQYAGQYVTEGNSTPVKLRSSTTLRAISIYEGRADTKSNPVWYSFGSIVLALRYLVDSKVLEVDIVQVTDLPPGKEKASVDFQVGVNPGRRRSWVKKVQPGPHHNTQSFDAKTTVKVRKLVNRSFVASAWVNLKRPWPHLALGHAIVPQLEAQALTSGEWRVFPLQLRQGFEIQDHLGMALVALSCCERTFGFYTFTVDVMHIRNVKVQRLGDGVVASSKVKVELWIKAQQLTEGLQKKYETPSTILMRPAGYDEAQGWEAIFKHGCSMSFSVPKEKVHLSTIILQIHGRVRQRLTSKEAHFGTIKLGPEELFGGDNSAARGPWPNMAPLASASDPDETGVMKNVPGDPLDSRLTHWGQSLRRMAKVEMWHRLQI